MKLPATSLHLPFLAYGMFKSGEIGFLRIKDHVSRVKRVTLRGSLLERDGVLLFSPEGESEIDSNLIFFKAGAQEAAYQSIGELEPGKLYRWESQTIDGTESNILVGVNTSQNASPVQPYSSWSDPMFTEALEVIERDLHGEQTAGDIFRLQANYMLLWSAIERYAGLRYGLYMNPNKKVEMLAGEPAFANRIESPARSEKKYKFLQSNSDGSLPTPSSPKKEIEHYYGIRSNVVHVGKTRHADVELLQNSTNYMLDRFRKLLDDAKLMSRFQGQVE